MKNTPNLTAHPYVELPDYRVRYFITDNEKPLALLRFTDEGQAEVMRIKPEEFQLCEYLALNQLIREKKTQLFGSTHQSGL